MPDARLRRARRPVSTRRATSPSSSSATPAKATRRSTSLRDQLLAVAGHEDVKFVVISSDVVYPTGAMRDYESEVLAAVQGRDQAGLRDPRQPRLVRRARGVRATFLEPDAARAAMRARVEADLRITSTTDATDRRADRQAARLRQRVRRADRLPARAVLRDPDRSLRADRGGHRRRQARRPGAMALAGGGARTRARARSIMAVLGHPVLRRRLRSGDAARGVRALYERLREHDVAIVMAGDTHDLEYYAEPPDRGGPDDASLRQRRRRRVPQLRHRARLAAIAGRRPTGRSIPATAAVVDEDRAADAVVEAAGLVVDATASAPGRSRPSGCRRSSTTTSRRSFRASSKCASSRRRAGSVSAPTASTAG